MSSILKALKKLEEQSLHPNESLPGPIGIKKTASRKTSELMRFRGILFIAAATFLLGILGGALWNRMPVRQETAAHLESSPMSVTGPVAAPMKSDPVPPPPVSPRKKATPPALLKNQEPASAFREPASKDIDRNRQTSDVPAPPPPRAASAPPAAEPPAVEAELKPLEDDHLDMQALTWSSDPEECFVVINNSIIRSGDTVEGYVVTHIDKDFVVVERENEKWALRFAVR